MYLVHLSILTLSSPNICSSYGAKSCPIIWRDLFQTKINLKTFTYFFLDNYDDKMDEFVDAS